SLVMASPFTRATTAGSWAGTGLTGATGGGGASTGTASSAAGSGGGALFEHAALRLNRRTSANNLFTERLVYSDYSKSLWRPDSWTCELSHSSLIRGSAGSRVRRRRAVNAVTSPPKASGAINQRNRCVGKVSVRSATHQALTTRLPVAQSCFVILAIPL